MAWPYLLWNATWLPQRPLGQPSRVPKQIWPGHAQLLCPAESAHTGTTACAHDLRAQLLDLGPGAEPGTARPLERRRTRGDEPSALRAARPADRRTILRQHQLGFGVRGSAGPNGAARSR